MKEVLLGKRDDGRIRIRIKLDKNEFGFWLDKGRILNAHKNEVTEKAVAWKEFLPTLFEIRDNLNWKQLLEKSPYDFLYIKNSVPMPVYWCRGQLFKENGKEIKW